MAVNIKKMECYNFFNKMNITKKIKKVCTFAKKKLEMLTKL